MNDDKRNFWLMFLDATLFANGMTFLSVTAVITYFLAVLGASTFEIGLANSLVSIGAFLTQPIFAKKVMNLTRKKTAFARILLTQRVIFLAFIATIPFLAPRNPHFMVLLFLVCWGIFNCFAGSYAPFYTSLFAKMIAEPYRGRLRGYSGAVGNLIALGSAVLVGVLLKDVTYPYNYTIIFGLGVFLLMIDAWDFAAMKETADKVVPFNLNYLQYYRAIPDLFRSNRVFRRIVVGFSLMVVCQVPLAYDALYGIREFHAGGTAIAIFTAVTALVNVIGSVVLGIVADRHGHRLVLVIAALAGGAGGLLPILVHQMAVVYVAFGLTTLCLGGYNISAILLIIETVSRASLPMCISVSTLITLMASSVATLASSFMIGPHSFTSVFVLAAVTGAGACLVLMGRRPRSLHRAAEAVQ